MTGAAETPSIAIGHIQRSLSDGERVSRIVVEDLRIAAPGRYALLAPSGSGKTTALEMLSLAMPPDEARDFVITTRDGAHPVTAGSSRDHAAIRSRNFGYVLQSILLLPFLTVLENVRLAQDIAGHADEDLARHLLDRLHLGALASAFPAHLSIGQRQRVCVARALAHRPSFVFADEPTSALDRVTADLCVNVLIEQCAANGAALLIVTHDAALADAFAFERLAVDTQVDGTQMETRIRQSGGAAWRG